METTTLSLSSARLLHLAAQGLLSAPKGKASKARVLASIRQMAVLQIDTINVVARSPYLVLWSRLGAFQMQWLEELLAEGKLFEYWSHEACFVPIEDYGLYRHQMISPQGLGWKFNQRWLAEHPQEIQLVKEHIHQHGPSRSIDFNQRSKKTTGWWEWKPEKRSLEVLFTTGELMIARRQSFQRVYDLRERVHPAWNDARDLTDALSCQRQQVLMAVKALGCAKASWIADYFRMTRLDTANQPQTLAAAGFLLTATGWDGTILYIHPDHKNLLKKAQQGKLKASITRLLSPFDPVVWDRKRALDLFAFDYRLECYTPAEKRRYGYFTLPILRRGALIGRLDAKAHRAQGRFEIKSLHLEASTRLSQAMVRDVMKCIQEFANWHETPDVDISELHGSVFGGYL